MALLAKVESTIVGQDGSVRGATLRLPDKNGQTVLHRPLQLLYPLEINCRGDDNTTKCTMQTGNTSEDIRVEV